MSGIEPPGGWPEGTKPYVIYMGKRNCKCKGPKGSCAGTIEKNEIRFGTRGAILGHTQIFHRHLRCATTQMLKTRGIDEENFDEAFDFEGLSDEQEEEAKVMLKAILRGEAGAVRQSPVKRKKEDGDEEKPKKKAAKKKAPKDDE